MRGLTIRRAELEDAAALCELHKASVKGLCAGAYSAEQIEAWLSDRAPDGFRHAMTGGGETMLVAERGRTIVGFASIREAMLFGLYVHPVIGRGTGGLLLGAAEDHARRHGVSVFSLQATLNAVPFYRRRDFSIDGCSTVLRAGRKLPVVDMSKSLRTTG